MTDTAVATPDVAEETEDHFVHIVCPYLPTRAFCGTDCADVEYTIVVGHDPDDEDCLTCDEVATETACTLFATCVCCTVGRN